MSMYWRNAGPLRISSCSPASSRNLRVAGAFAVHIVPGQAVKLAIDDGDQLVEGMRITLTPRAQKPAHIGSRGGSAGSRIFHTQLGSIIAYGLSGDLFVA